MSSPKTIADIKLNLLRPALTSHFAVTIPKPGGGFDGFLASNGITLTSLNQGKLNLLCSEAVLPGSNLATFEINDNFHGVTERHAYRRVYDDRIDLTFYVDAENYLPIRFFETWIKYIVDESMNPQADKGVGSEDSNYFYRVRYPEGSNGYTSADGLTVTKFERDYRQNLEYKFIRSFPISINSMPVSYDSSSLLKCTVSMSYIRYVLIQGIKDSNPQSSFNLTPQQLSDINSRAFDPNVNLGVAPLTTGGIPLPPAQASGNNVSRAFSGASLI